MPGLRLQFNSSAALVFAKPCLPRVVTSSLQNKIKLHAEVPSGALPKSVRTRPGQQRGPVTLLAILNLTMSCEGSRFTNDDVLKPLWEGCRESKKCSRDTYAESYITQYTRVPGGTLPENVLTRPGQHRGPLHATLPLLNLNS